MDEVTAASEPVKMACGVLTVTVHSSLPDQKTKKKGTKVVSMLVVKQRKFIYKSSKDLGKHAFSFNCLILTSSMCAEAWHEVVKTCMYTVHVVYIRFECISQSLLDTLPYSRFFKPLKVLSKIACHI